MITLIKDLLAGGLRWVKIIVIEGLGANNVWAKANQEYFELRAGLLLR